MNTLYAWDFHGVLERGTVYSVMETCNEVMGKFGKKRRITWGETLEWYGKSWTDYLLGLSPESDKDEVCKMKESAISIGKEIKKKYTKPMDYASEVLRKIKKNGDSNIVLSNARPESVEDFIETVGLMEYVDEYFGVPPECERNLCIATHKGGILRDYSSKNGFSKIVMTGDKETDIKAGKHADALTFRFIDTDLLLNKEVISKIKEESEADYVITDLRDVLKYGPMV